MSEYYRKKWVVLFAVEFGDGRNTRLETFRFDEVPTNLEIGAAKNTLKDKYERAHIKFLLAAEEVVRYDLNLTPPDPPEPIEE